MNDFEALAIMSKENLDIKMFPDIISANMVTNLNGHITFGVDAKTITRMAGFIPGGQGSVVLALYVADQKQFFDVKARKPTGVQCISKERMEQIEKHGFSLIDHDDYYQDGELKLAATYCLTQDWDFYPQGWGNWFLDKIKEKEKRLSKEEFQIEMAAIAGAFCAAEIDRLNLLSK